MTKLFREFFRTEKSSGIILIICTVLSLALANSPVAESYAALWQFPVAGHSIVFWINDVFMALFFLLIGLEIEREIYIGELSNPRKALLPIIAAAGGMIGPAIVHFSLNAGTDSQSGFGIPMATDIAFSLGILSLLGTRIPVGIKVFLTALAIVDDLGAIVVIAVFYTTSVSLMNLVYALLIAAILFTANRMKVRTVWLYLFGGIVLWYFIHESGIHATIAGVILAFLIPFGKGEEPSPSASVEHILVYIVPFVVLPLFALANTVITIDSSSFSSLFHLNSIGIIAGLIIGNVAGINLAIYLAVKTKISSLPAQSNMKHIFGVSLLAGIGFTMGIFITMLAFQDTTLIEQSKFAILVASLIAGVSGYFFLRAVSHNDKTAVPQE